MLTPRPEAATREVTRIGRATPWSLPTRQLSTGALAGGPSQMVTHRADPSISSPLEPTQWRPQQPRSATRCHRPTAKPPLCPIRAGSIEAEVARWNCSSSLRSAKSSWPRLGCVHHAAIAQPSGHHPTACRFPTSRVLRPQPATGAPGGYPAAKVGSADHAHRRREPSTRGTTGYPFWVRKWRGCGHRRRSAGGLPPRCGRSGGAGSRRSGRQSQGRCRWSSPRRLP